MLPYNRNGRPLAAFAECPEGVLGFGRRKRGGPKDVSYIKYQMKKGKDHVHEEIGRAVCGCFWIGGKPGNRLCGRQQHCRTGALAFDRLRGFNRCGGCSGGPGQKEKEINKNVGTAVRAILAKKLTPSGKKLLFRGCCFIMNSSTNWNLREEQKCK